MPRTARAKTIRMSDIEVSASHFVGRNATDAGATEWCEELQLFLKPKEFSHATETRPEKVLDVHAGIQQLSSVISRIAASRIVAGGN